MSRTYADAITALNTLQTNSAIVDAIRKSGKSLNQQAIPEMIEWCRRIGYEPDGFGRLNLIHIAGTKGKGSTSAFVSSILSQYLDADDRSLVQGRTPIRSIGLYTSPHLRFVRERIQINNAPLSEEKFAHYFFQTWDRLEDSARSSGRDPRLKPVYFRFLTLMAFHVYMSEGVSTAIIECGIGGEYDSTNVLARPVATGITNLAIDHTGMLGDSIEEIAWHKAGIMKEGTRSFTVPQKRRAMEVLQERARQKRVDLQVVPVHPELESDSAPLGLSAPFQKSNASLAIAIAQHLLSSFHFPEISTTPLNQQFKRGLKDVRWGGRCETRHEPGIMWCIDGGHTLESIELVGRWFAEQVCKKTTTTTSDDSHHPNTTASDSKRGNKQPQQRQKRILVFNQQTRDANALARALHSTLEATNTSRTSPFFTHTLFCPNITFKATGSTPDHVAVNIDPDAIRGLSVQKGLARAWAELDPATEVRVLASIEEAVEVVRDVAGAADCKASDDDDRGRHGHEDLCERVPVLVTGSLHLVGGLLEVLETSTVGPCPSERD